MCLHTVKKVYIYVLIVNSWLGILYLNELELISLHTNIDIVCTQLNGFKYWNTTLKVLFNINCILLTQIVLFAHS